MEDYKKESRKNYTSGTYQKNATNEQLQVGCLQRIADSLEKIEEPYKKLIEENQWLSKRYREVNIENEGLRHSIRGYKAAITRMKNKL